MEWYYGGQPAYCRDCAKAQNQLGKAINCFTCDNRCPDILPANEEVMEVWALCSRQLLVSMAGPYGFNLDVVLRVAERLGVEVTPAFLERVNILESAVLEAISEQAPKGGDTVG